MSTLQEQKVVDFDKISEHKEAFQDCQVGFCCLGTTKGKSGMVSFGITIVQQGCNPE